MMPIAMLRLINTLMYYLSITIASGAPIKIIYSYLYRSALLSFEQGVHGSIASR